MRAIKKITLGFGLVSIPAKLYKATDSHDITFHQYHQDCLGSVGNLRICKGCGDEVQYADIVKGIEVGERVVTVTNDELRELEDEQGSQVEIVKFVSESDIDPIRFDTTYYLEPDKATDGYLILRQVLAESGFVGLVKIQLRQRCSLGVLRIIDDVLSITTLHWNDEVRPTTTLKIPTGKADDKMVGVAHQLVAAMVGKFDPEEFTDTYTERLSALVDAKVQGEPTVSSMRAEAATEDVSDLLAALELSIVKKGERV